LQGYESRLVAFLIADLGVLPGMPKAQFVAVPGQSPMRIVRKAIRCLVGERSGSGSASVSSFGSAGWLDVL
jgi:hypothetical protein